MIIGDESFVSVSEAIEGMKFRLGVDADRELAVRLRTAPHNVAAWRRRKSIPEKYLTRYRRLLDETASEARYRPYRFQPFEVAEIAPPMLLEAYVYSLIATAAYELLSDRGRGTDDYLEIGVGFRLIRLEKFIRSRFATAEVADKDEYRSIFQTIKTELLGADLWLLTEAL